MAAVTDEINNGMIEDIVKSSINTSKANITPATGALKIAAIAPAAPHAINSVFAL